MKALITLAALALLAGCGKSGNAQPQGTVKPGQSVTEKAEILPPITSTTVDFSKPDPCETCDKLCRTYEQEYRTSPHDEPFEAGPIQVHVKTLQFSITGYQYKKDEGTTYHTTEYMYTVIRKKLRDGYTCTDSYGETPFGALNSLRGFQGTGATNTSHCVIGPCGHTLNLSIAYWGRVFDSHSAKPEHDGRTVYTTRLSLYPSVYVDVTRE